MELSQNDIYSLLSAAIRKAAPSSGPDVYGPYVRDIYPTYLVYAGTADKLFECAYTIDKVSHEVTLGSPTEVVQVTNYAPVTTTTFSLPATASFSTEDVVVREGQIFKAGTFTGLPGGDFTITEQELADAVANFEPAPIDLDHHETVFDGLLGQLTSVELREGGVLFGRAELPKWLDDKLGDGARKVSCTWDRTTKQLKKLALTKNPRLTDAALFTAYATFAGARHSTQDMADLQKIHDLVVKQGAACSSKDSQATMSHTPTNPLNLVTPQRKAQRHQKENKNMSFMDRLADFIKGVPSEELAAFTSGSGEDPTEPTGTSTTTTTTTPTPSPSPSPTPDPKVAALEAQLAQQTAAFAKVQDERRVEKATSKVDGYIAQGKALPHERATAIAAFTKAMQDDERNADTVTFSDAEGKAQTVTRTQLVELQYQARPAHTLTEEQVVAFALPSGGDNKDSDQEHQKKLAALIGVTSMGKAALNGKNN